jgi:phosphonate transport system permease protein
MSSKVKKLIFDTVFFTYSAGLFAYVGVWFLQAAGADVTVPSEESFVAGFSTYLLAAGITAAVMAIAAAILSRFSIGTVGAKLFTAGVGPAARDQERGGWLTSFSGLHLLIAFVLTLLVSLRVTESSFAELLDRDGVEGALRLWGGLSHPNLALLPKAIAQVAETVYIAFLATTLAVPTAFFLAFFSAKNIMTGPVAQPLYTALRAVLNIIRSVEPLIWALIFTVWVGVGPFAGMLALMVHSVASLTKYYSEIIESVSQGPIDGIVSTGANPVQVIWYAIVPQVILPYIAMTIYLWDTNVRMATVIGLVGGGGIGTLLIQYQGQAMWPEVGSIILVIAVVVWLMDTASAYIREALK